MIKDFKIYKKCLIIVDMVNGFVKEGVLHDKNIEKTIPHQIKLIKDALASKDTLVIFIKDTHDENAKEFIRFGNTKHCVRGSREAELVDELKKYENKENVIMVEKNSTSFMEAINFRKVIYVLENVLEYKIAGCCTDICVFNGAMGLANYLDEWNQQAIVKVYLDAVATYNEENRQNYVDAACLLMEQQGIKLIKKR